MHVAHVRVATVGKICRKRKKNGAVTWGGLEPHHLSRLPILLTSLQTGSRNTNSPSASHRLRASLLLSSVLDCSWKILRHQRQKDKSLVTSIFTLLCDVSNRKVHVAAGMPYHQQPLRAIYPRQLAPSWSWWALLGVFL